MSTATPALHQDSEVTAAAPASRTVTIEMALYAGLFLLALFLRLFRLGLAPLSPGEAAQALAALEGGPIPIGSSPAWQVVNSLLMSIFGASDTIVRLGPALVGSALVLTPAMFRDAIGRWGALGAALLLAISPVGLAASRSLDGAVLAVACGLFMIGLARQYLASGDARRLVGAAVALGIGLASGPGIYTIGLSLIAGALAVRFALGSVVSDVWRELWRGIAHSPNRWHVALGFVVSFALASTGLLVHLAGIGASADLLMAWLGAFGSGGSLSAFDVVQILMVYEPAALILGLIGFALMLMELRRAPTDAPTGEDAGAAQAPARVRRLPLFGPWLGFVAVIALVLVVMQTGRRPFDLLWPMTLLAILSGPVFQALADEVQSGATVAVDGIVVTCSAAGLAFALVTLASYARGHYLTTNVAGLALAPEISVLLALGIVAVLIGLIALVFGLRPLARGAGVVAVGGLVLWTFAAGWGATQVRVGDARELVWGSEVTTPGARVLTETLRQIAIRAQGHAFTLPIQIETDDPVVRWYARGAEVPVGKAPAGVVTAAGSRPSEAGGTYIGTQIDIRKAWDALGLPLDEWLKWAMYRESAEFPPQVTQSVTVWERK